MWMMRTRRAWYLVRLRFPETEHIYGYMVIIKNQQLVVRSSHPEWLRRSCIEGRERWQIARKGTLSCPTTKSSATRQIPCGETWQATNMEMLNANNR